MCQVWRVGVMPPASSGISIGGSRTVRGSDEQHCKSTVLNLLNFPESISLHVKGRAVPSPDDGPLWGTALGIIHSLQMDNSTKSFPAKSGLPRTALTNLAGAEQPSGCLRGLLVHAVDLWSCVHSGICRAQEP
jgi:hypothetical protein